MSAWAVIPVKSFSRAKSRLAGALSSDDRGVLARRMFEHVLARALTCPAIDGVLVLTNGDDVEDAARARGAQVLRDRLAPAADDTPAGAGHLGRVVDAGLAHLAERGADACVVLMADLPELAGADIEHMVERLRATPVVIAPDRHEQGTNALALAPPTRLSSTCFGHPDSLARHLERAREHGVEAALYRSASLALDIDVPADISGAAAPLALDQ